MNDNYELHDATVHGLVDKVKTLIKQGADVHFAKPTHLLQPLHYTAIWNGHEKIAELLLDAKANVDATSKSGHTALMFAVNNQYPRLVKLLLERKADTSLTVTEPGNSDFGKTAIDLACNDNEMLFLFAKPAPPAPPAPHVVVEPVKEAA